MKSLTKEEIVSKVAELYKTSQYAVFVNYSGINAENMSSFRGELRKNGLRFLVVKNTLNRKAMEGTEFKNGELLKNQCGVIFCDDLMKVAKTLNKFCFVDKNVQYVACLNKSEICNVEEIKELASLPSMEVLRTKLLYMLNSAGSAFVRALNEAVEKGRKNCPNDKDEKVEG